MYIIFKNEINRLLAKTQTGGGWEITFTDKEDITHADARATYNVGNRWVRFSLNRKKVKTKQSALKVARHEFGHFIIARMEWLAGCRYITDSEIDEESEAFARVIEKLCN